MKPILERLKDLPRLSVLPHYSYGQPYVAEPKEQQALMFQVARITGSVGYPIHLRMSGGAEEFVQWIIDKANNANAKITLNSSHFYKTMSHLVGVFNRQDDSFQIEWGKFLVALDFAKKLIPEALIGDLFIFDFEILRYVPPLTELARRNNVDLLWLQTNMFEEVKQRWPSIKVNWYRHYYLRFGQSNWPYRQWTPSPYTCPETPGEFWNATLYQATAPYPYNDWRVSVTAENGLMHGVKNGILWVGPGYSVDHNSYRGRSRRANDDWQPSSEIWWQWGRTFVHDFWNPPHDVNNGKYFEWKNLLAGIVLYPPAGTPNMTNQFEYLYQYFRGLLLMDYENATN